MTAAEAVQWAALAFAALVIGLSKTAMPAASSLAVAIFATQLSARASTGAILVLLIVGDLTAVGSYRRQADWRTVGQLIPSVLVGIAAGAAVLAVVDDELLRRLIGVVLLALLVATIVPRFRRRRAEDPLPAASVPAPAMRVPVAPAQADQAPRGAGSRWRALGFGVLGGFTTMAANAGGPVMSAYFLASRFSVQTFLGTAAWFFLVVNLIKLPIAIGMGLLGVPELLRMLPLIPVVLVGAVAGRLWARVMRRTVFETVVLVLTLVSAVTLLV